MTTLRPDTYRIVIDAEFGTFVRAAGRETARFNHCNLDVRDRAVACYVAELVAAGFRNADARIAYR